MNHRLAKVYPAMLWLAAAVNPAVAQTASWNPVSSDGLSNTAVGSGALANPDLDDDGGCHNTAAGENALNVDTSGSYNTAMGLQSLASNLDGGNNTGVGAFSLNLNTSGGNNTAAGYQSLYSNSSGSENAAMGYNALYANTTGANNTAFGATALNSNTTGKGNAAQGVGALFNNTSGIRNLAIGSNALYDNNGSYNIALGFDAGYNVTTGSNNIEIGAEGTASDNNTIQIGVQGTQLTTRIAGIYGTPVTGSAVYVTASGQLGIMGSSERFKTDIATMPDLSTKLAALRPVTFHYKTDAGGALQYGLIAEEVDRVYPELVIRDDKGKIQGVRYEELAPMLLGQLQQQQAKLAEIDQLKQDLRVAQNELKELKEFKQSMQAAMEKLLAKDDRLAMR